MSFVGNYVVCPGCLDDFVAIEPRANIKRIEVRKDACDWDGPECVIAALRTEVAWAMANTDTGPR